jgi:FixJ family two-component response regulator
MKEIVLSDEQYSFFSQAERLNNDLTPRQRGIAKLAAQGFSNAEIAHRLGISHKTVVNHIEHIMGKARSIYGNNVNFRSHIIPELHTYYFFQTATGGALSHI